MNTPSPLIPQGALPNARGRSHIRIAVFAILAVHVVLLGALLMAGCKKTTDQAKNDASVDTGPPPFNANELPVNTNVPAPAVTSAPPVAATPIPPPLPTTTRETGTAPSSLAEGTEHTIMKGDSFYTLAKKYNVSQKAIVAANPGVDPTRLKIGQKVKIPPSTVGGPATPAGNGATVLSSGSDKIYSVKSGDTLNRIASTHGISLKALRAENGLKTDRITVGQKLRIPSKGTSGVESAPATPAGGGTTP